MGEFKLKELESFVLERTKFAIARRFSGSFLEDIKYTTVIDHEIEGIILRLEKSILSHKLEKVVRTVHQPKTWWDHFKFDCFPLWLYEKFPPKFTIKKITFDWRVIFPRLTLIMRADERFKEFYVWESMTEGDE